MQTQRSALILPCFLDRPVWVSILFCFLTIQSGRAIEPLFPEMVVVPGGPFIFGGTVTFDSSVPLSKHALPRQIVDCPTFSISVYEISSAEFYRFIQDGGYDTLAFWPRDVHSNLARWKQQIPSRFPRDNSPVSGVTFYEAEAYCLWLTEKTGVRFRLPTEIEWEKAARGTDGRLFPWGNEWNQTACNWNDDRDGDFSPEGKIDGYRNQSPVGTYPQGISPYGCHDMAGNVWEWCDTWFDPSRERFKVVKGGHWLSSYPRHISSVYRSGCRPDIGVVFSGLTGFRVANND